MAQFFSIHPHNPQLRLIKQAVKIIEQGGVIAYPTDSSYALGCQIGNKQAMDRITRIRRVDDSHNFTLICNDLSQLSVYAKIENEKYRLIKRLTPGPYTFILPATREVPRRLQNEKKRSIGLRVPDFPLVRELLAELGEPLMSSTLWLPGDDLPLNDAYLIREKLEHDIDLVIDGEACELQPTTVIDMIDDAPSVLRYGRGDYSLFE